MRVRPSHLALAAILLSAGVMLAEPGDAAPKRRAGHAAAHPALPPGSHPATGRTYPHSFGPLTVRTFDQTRFIGTYPYHTGRIEAEAQGDRITGYWYQVEGGHPCDTERGGTKNWGHVTLTFSPDGKSFEGVEGYCDDAPTYPWNSQ